MFKLAELFVEIGANDKPLRQSLANVQALLGGAALKMASAAGNMASSLAQVEYSLSGIATKATLVGVALGAAFYKSVQKASELNETISKTSVIMGDSSKVIIDQAKQMSQDFGLIKNEMIDAGATFSLYAQNAGLGKEAAAQFAKSLVNLGAQVGSMDNVEKLPEVLNAIRSGLTGEMEPLKRFGAMINADMVEAQALSMGLADMHGHVKEGGKILARYSLIMQSLNYAAGDLERTADQTANQQRRMFGNFVNVMTDVGSLVMPIWDKILAVVNRSLNSIQQYLADNENSFREWVSFGISKAQEFHSAFSTFVAEPGILGIVRSVTDAIVTMGKKIGEAIDLAIVGMRNWSNVWALAKITVQEKFLNIVDIGKWGFNALKELLSWFSNNWVDVLKTSLNATVTMFKNTFINIRDLVDAGFEYIMSWGASGWNFKSTPLLDGLKNEIKQLPKIPELELTNLDNLREQELDQMNRKEQELLDKQKNKNAKQAGANGKPYQAVPLPEKEKDQKAHTLGLEEYVRKLQEGVFGDKNAREQLAAMNRIAENTGRMVNRPAPLAVPGP